MLYPEIVREMGDLLAFVLPSPYFIHCEIVGPPAPAAFVGQVGLAVRFTYREHMLWATAHAPLAEWDTPWMQRLAGAWARNWRRQQRKMDEAIAAREAIAEAQAA